MTKILTNLLIAVLYTLGITAAALPALAAPAQAQAVTHHQEKRGFLWGDKILVSAFGTQGTHMTNKSGLTRGSRYATTSSGGTKLTAAYFGGLCMGHAEVMLEADNAPTLFESATSRSSVTLQHQGANGDLFCAYKDSRNHWHFGVNHYSQYLSVPCNGGNAYVASRGANGACQSFNLVAGNAIRTTAVQAPLMHYHGRAPTTASQRTCDERYKYSDGDEGILSHPFAKAAWTHNTCEWHLEVKVRYTTSCIDSAHSGSVKAINLWSEADGTGHVYCSAWIRFRQGGENWGSWNRLPNTNVQAPAHLTSMVHNAPTGMRRIRSWADLPASLRTDGPFTLDLNVDRGYVWSPHGSHAILVYHGGSQEKFTFTTNGHVMISTWSGNTCYRSVDNTGQVMHTNSACRSSRCYDKWVWYLDNQGRSTFQDESCPTSLNLYAGDFDYPVNGDFITLEGTTRDFRWYIPQIAAALKGVRGV